MTHPNGQTNGASLEDCHTNFFALTDLCGIRWRRLSSETLPPVSASIGGSSNPYPGFHPGGGGGAHGRGPRSANSLYGSDWLQDPVLASYWRCLQADVLCVWRKVPGAATSPPTVTPTPNYMSPHPQSGYPPYGNVGMSPMAPPTPQTPGPNSLNPLSGAKELWVFWYGEEPDLATLIVPELLATEGNQGSWEESLSYECRSLLFKALHNLIERCLLTRDFVRLGNWFVQPYEGLDPVSGQSNTHLSFGFTFFVHGDSTVCASLDVRQHPPVRKLSKRHLTAATASSTPVQVLLAPYGLAGTLTGQSFRSDPQTVRLLEEWKQFYPLDIGGKNTTAAPDNESPSATDSMPPMVEVLIGGTRMRYPTNFVLVTDMDDASNAVALSHLASIEGGLPLTPPSSPCPTPSKTPSSAPPPAVLPPPYPVPQLSVSPPPAAVLTEQAWEDSLLLPGCFLHSQNETPTTSDAQPTSSQPQQQQQPLWEFVEPATRAACTCAKFKRQRNRLGSSSNSNVNLALGNGTISPAHGSVPSSKPKSDKSIGKSSSSMPFHRRKPLPVWKGPVEEAERAEDDEKRSGQASTTPGHSSYRGTGTSNPTLVPPMSASPASVVPSPLPTPHSQPASVPPTDTAMPTLSPHPPASHEPGTNGAPPTPAEGEHKGPVHTPLGGTVSQPLDSNSLPGGHSSSSGGPKSAASLHNQSYSPYGSSSVETKAGADTPGPGPASGSGWPHSVGQGPASSSGADRPPKSQGPANAATPSGSGFGGNIGTSSAGGHGQDGALHGRRPVLPVRDYEQTLQEEGDDLQHVYDYSTVNAWLYHPVKKFRSGEKSNENDRVTKPSTALGPSNDLTAIGLPGTPVHPMDGDRCDPYDFDEEHGESRKRKREEDVLLDGENEGGEDSPSKPVSTPVSLYTKEGLSVSYKDLENIFDNSDETSNDAFPVPTPPGSNKPAGLPEDTAALLSNTKALTHNSNLKTVLNPSPSNPHNSVHILGAAELCKMFPTPPSHEHPMQSPMGVGSLDCIIDGGSMNDGVVAYQLNNIKQERGAESPMYASQDLVRDWSFVYKPPVMSKFLGSAKYAPLPLLPSQSLPPLPMPANAVYKPSWQQNKESGPASNNSHSQGGSSHSQSGSQSSSLSVAIKEEPQPPQRLVPRPMASLTQFPPLNLPRTPTHFFPRPPMPSPYHSDPCASPAPVHPHQPPVTHPSHALHRPPHHGPIQPEAPAPLPESHGLLVTLLLGDSLLNLFRDHNFDSCALCVCNAGPNSVGTLKGADYHLLPENLKSRTLYEEESLKCNCGFSVIMNRRLAHRAGLFYEDEVEITGANLTPDPEPARKGSLLRITQFSSSSSTKSNRVLDALPWFGQAVDHDKDLKDRVDCTIAAVACNAALIDSIPQPILELLREQCLSLHTSTSPISRAAALHNYHANHAPLHLLEYIDGCDVSKAVLQSVILPPEPKFSYPPHPAANPYSMGPNFGNVVAKTELVHAAPGARNAVGSSSSSSTLSSSAVAALGNTRSTMHRWPFLQVPGPSASQDIMRVMKGLQPLLQDAIQKKRRAGLWEATYTVLGPLTWRQFHRMAARGTEDQCEPQPIPLIVAGYDRDWVTLAPLGIPHWERLLLEPYAPPRDIAYIVVCPDVDFILGKTKTFFKELSAVYELCRLGRHVPITKVLRDGMLRIGKSAAANLAQEPIEEWFTAIGDSPVAAMLRLYAQVCRHHLAPHLTTLPLDRTLLEPASKATMAPPPPMTSLADSQAFSQPSQPPSATPGQGTPGGQPGLDGKPASPRTESSVEEGGPAAYGTGIPLDTDDDDAEPPAIVIYLVDPFTLGSDDPDLHRLASIGLLRCYHHMLSFLPENVQNNITLQLISVESVVQLGRDSTGCHQMDQLRGLALHVFSQCRKTLIHSSPAKCLTGLGPAANLDQFLKSKDEKNRSLYRLQTPPYILAPLKDKSSDLDQNVGSCPTLGPTLGRTDKFSVLYVSYCLSEDQRWLLASCTDDRGEMMDTVTIGIDIPHRSRRKRVSARRFGLQRLMDFILGVISSTVQPWRLVISRLGRMGHGELKGWSALLSRKSLIRTSKHLAELCNTCSLSQLSEAPILLSACLVSLEPDSTLRLMPDQVTPDERFGQQSANSALSTPEDASCTHILVFPTSATTTSSQTTFQEQHMNVPGLGDDELFPPLNDDMGDMGDDFGMGDLGDIFSSCNWPETENNDNDNDGDMGLGGNMGLGDLGGLGGLGGDGNGGGPNSPSRKSGGMRGMRSGSHPDSPSNHMGMGMSGRASPQRGSGNQEPAEEVGTLLQQPLALGYLLSTAPTGPMPSWFWASCPQLASACPVFLKCALHLHSTSVQQNSDDFLQQSTTAKMHPLDSQFTTDVLRYVMEGYNALSWLAMDPKTRDRRSCLPVHIQLLVQLYHTLAALV